MLGIAVCIKQIPMIEEANFDPRTKTIKRDGPAVISAFDLRAISLAIGLKRRFGAEVAVVTMGPPQAEIALREALAMGADRAVHLQDRAFAGSDTLATATALALWLKRHPWDLILLGKHSLDAETGQVGPEIAELLEIAHITAVRKLEIGGDSVIRAQCESDEGFDEIECVMPALVTCAERVAQPIRVKPQDREAAKVAVVETVTAADLSEDHSRFGFAGSPTYVDELKFIETPKIHGRIIDASDPIRAAHELVTALNETGALEPGDTVQRRLAGGIRKPVQGRDIWVACEMDLKRQIRRGSLELLSRAAELAQVLGGAVTALVTGGANGELVDLLGAHGADLILALESQELESYSPDTMAQAVAELIRERAPWGLWLSATERGRDWGPRLAARLKLGLTGDAIGLELREKDRLIALKPAFGGNIVAPIISKTYPQMATVRPGVLDVARRDVPQRPAVETVTPKAGKPLSRILCSHSLLDESLRSLEGANIVVGVGMGVGGPEGVETIKELARVLDAGLCATRRVTDEGWLPRQLQVGLTGKAIDPRLYIAVGIRGAPNHTVGIKHAGTVVAINNDPDALIFDRATFRLVADWSAVVPPLIEALRKSGARRA